MAGRMPRAATCGCPRRTTRCSRRRGSADGPGPRRPWRVISHDLRRFPKDVRFYPRGALVARLGRSGHRLWAISTHFGLSPGARRRNADELVSQVLALDGPVVAGGDLNEGPAGNAATWLSSRLRDAWAEAGE